MQEQQPEKEKDLIFGQLDEIRQIEIEGYQFGVKRARNALFLVAGLTVFGELFFAFFITHYINIYVFSIVIFVALIFIALGLLNKVKPYTALISALITYISFTGLTVAFNSLFDGAFGVLASLFGGIVIKAIIISILVRAIPDARKLQQIMTER